MEWSTKQTAKKLGISSRSLRYYEVRGMLNPIRKGQIQYYDEEQRSRILEIIRGKQLGFSLTEIKGFLSVAGDTVDANLQRSSVGAHIEYLTQKKLELEEALSHLNRLQSGSNGQARGFLSVLDDKFQPGYGRAKSIANLHRADEFTTSKMARD